MNKKSKLRLAASIVASIAVIALCATASIENQPNVLKWIKGAVYCLTFAAFVLLVLSYRREKKSFPVETVHLGISEFFEDAFPQEESTPGADGFGNSALPVL